MKTLFTVHAGEYLVGSEIEKRFKKLQLWLPSKDTGVDLLITNGVKRKFLGIQVKFSKDFLATDKRLGLYKNLHSFGWWTLDREKIRKSNADFWIFVLYNLSRHEVQYLIIKPKQLLRVLEMIHGGHKSINVYLWVTKQKTCWEARGLSNVERDLINRGEYSNLNRNLTKFLNDWKSVTKRLN